MRIKIIHILSTRCDNVPAEVQPHGAGEQRVPDRRGDAAARRRGRAPAHAPRVVGRAARAALARAAAGRERQHW